MNGFTQFLTGERRGWKDPDHNASPCEPGYRWYSRSTSDSPCKRNSRYLTTKTISSAVAAEAEAMDRRNFETTATFYLSPNKEEISNLFNKKSKKLGRHSIETANKKGKEQNQPLTACRHHLNCHPLRKTDEKNKKKNKQNIQHFWFFIQKEKEKFLLL